MLFAEWDIEDAKQVWLEEAREEEREDIARKLHEMGNRLKR